MPKKRTKPAKASAVTKKAVEIYDDQKATYQKMLKTKFRQGKKVTTAAKEASSVYKQMYGATPCAKPATEGTARCTSPSASPARNDKETEPS